MSNSCCGRYESQNTPVKVRFDTPFANPQTGLMIQMIHDNTAYPSTCGANTPQYRWQIMRNGVAEYDSGFGRITFTITSKLEVVLNCFQYEGGASAFIEYINGKPSNASNQVKNTDIIQLWLTTKDCEGKEYQTYMHQIQ